MTTARNIATNITRDIGQTSQSQGRFRLPNPPQREPDEMTSFDQLHRRGHAENLALYFGKPETTLVAAERWMVQDPQSNRSRACRPDLLIAFDVDPAIYGDNNGYIVSEQGKPPDFVMEIASATTADKDTGEKREDYRELGITEYWRFDKTGEYHGTRLAGDKLADSVYVPVPIKELEDGILQGYSAALDLNIRWEHGQLGWYNPVTGQHIPTHEYERTRADREQEARIQAEAQIRERDVRDREKDARIRELEARDRENEARIREQDEEIRRLRGG